MEEGDFRPSEPAPERYRGEDEIAVFYRDFQIMLRRINTLLQDNYLKQIEIREAELQTLQAQINPHFLYNTLDSIHWLARTGRTNDISRMARALANLLRSAIGSDRQEISLAEELALLEDYVFIQSLRFGDRLRFSLRASDEARECRVPSMTLQPLVENSIRFGVESSREGSTVTVSAERNDGELVLSVQDDGAGMSEELAHRVAAGQVERSVGGIGLKNIRSRLALLYGDHGKLGIDSAPGDGTTVTIRIPARVVGPESSSMETPPGWEN